MSRSANLGLDARQQQQRHFHPDDDSRGSTNKRFTEPFDINEETYPRQRRKQSHQWLKDQWGSTMSLLSPGKRQRNRGLSESSNSKVFTYSMQDIHEAGEEWVCTPLIAAARQGHVAVVDLLLQGGAEVNSKCCCGGTALYWAARFVIF